MSLPFRSRLSPRAAVVVALAVLAGLAVLTLPQSAHASANCPYTEFCIWKDANYTGGRYDFWNSDSTLYNDKFVGTNTVVANNGSSVQNNGSPQAYDAVRMYYWLSDNSPSLCVPRTAKYPHLSAYRTRYGNTWNDEVVRYAWVTSC
jgi:hypothetical protein